MAIKMHIAIFMLLALFMYAYWFFGTGTRDKYNAAVPMFAAGIFFSFIDGFIWIVWWGFIAP